MQTKIKTAQILLLLSCSLLLIPTSLLACEDKTENSKCVQVSVNDKQGNGIADIVVYLSPLSGQKLPKTDDVITISQKNQAFTPYISVTQLGNKVNFANKDDITHHIYSVSSKDKFAFKIKADTEHISAPFTDPAEVAMGCNIHDWMSGSLLVVDTPYFGKTDKNGNISFSISEVGQYNIIAWHPQLPTENKRFSQQHDILKDSNFQLILPKKLSPIPSQSNTDDFDFISDY